MNIEEQVEEPEIAKAKYKALVKFQLSPEWKGMVEAYNIKASVLMGEIKEHFAKREKAEITQTELEKLYDYIEFIKTLSNSLPDNEGAKVFAEELAIQVERAETHVFCKVELGFDTPMYTVMDVMKNMYNAHMTIDRKLSEVVGLYTPSKEEATHLDPYEEA